VSRRRRSRQAVHFANRKQPGRFSCSVFLLLRATGCRLCDAPDIHMITYKKRESNIPSRERSHRFFAACGARPDSGMANLSRQDTIALSSPLHSASTGQAGCVCRIARTASSTAAGRFRGERNGRRGDPATIPPIRHRSDCATCRRSCRGSRTADTTHPACRLPCSPPAQILLPAQQAQKADCLAGGIPEVSRENLPHSHEGLAFFSMTIHNARVVTAFTHTTHKEQWHGI
jgi:hypothetical protein